MRSIRRFLRSPVRLSRLALLCAFSCCTITAVTGLCGEDPATVSLNTQQQLFTDDTAGGQRRLLSRSAEPSDYRLKESPLTDALTLKQVKGECKGVTSLRQSPAQAELTTRMAAGGADALQFSDDQCAAALRMPKVALMFLTTGDMPHGKLWREWFESIAGRRFMKAPLWLRAGQLPVDNLRAANCLQKGTGLPLSRIAQLCADHKSANVIDRQHLFTVYVHNPPMHVGYDMCSPFFGHEVEDRVNTQWGTWSLTAATKSLMRAALAEPLNERFVLLSDQCVPLYPPATVYTQLINEERSRINACINEGEDTSIYRFSEEMETEKFKKTHWRKQWSRFTLLRRHAELVVSDTELEAVFEKYCVNLGIPMDQDPEGKDKHCLPDQHYVGTLLAVHGLEDETDCTGMIVNEDWKWDSNDPFPIRPKGYQNWEIDIALFKKLRQPSQCRVDDALFSAARLVGHVSQAQSNSTQLLYSEHMLNTSCPLFARKFPFDVSETVFTTLREAAREESLYLLDKYVSYS